MIVSHRSYDYHMTSPYHFIYIHKLTCRALKTKHDTPKYGLIYHASLVGQTAPKNKGKISRMLAAKASLCARVDALGEESAPSIGIESRVKVEDRVKFCEQNKVYHNRKLCDTKRTRKVSQHHMYTCTHVHTWC